MWHRGGPSAQFHARQALPARSAADSNRGGGVTLDGGTKIEPRLGPGEAQELASIAYFLARLESMRSRNLISPEAHATVAAEAIARRDEIERNGRYRGAMASAVRLEGSRPDEALRWAERAREI